MAANLSDDTIPIDRPLRAATAASAIGIAETARDPGGHLCGELYDAEEIMEAAQALPEMHAAAVRRCLAVANLLTTVRTMTGFPVQASLASDVEELGRAAECLRLATSRSVTTLAEAEAAWAAVDDACAAFNSASAAVAATVCVAFGTAATPNLPKRA